MIFIPGPVLGKKWTCPSLSCLHWIKIDSQTNGHVYAWLDRLKWGIIGFVLRSRASRCRPNECWSIDDDDKVIRRRNAGCGSTGPDDTIKQGSETIQWSSFPKGSSSFDALKIFARYMMVKTKASCLELTFSPTFVSYMSGSQLWLQGRLVFDLHLFL